MQSISMMIYNGQTLFNYLLSSNLQICFIYCVTYLKTDQMSKPSSIVSDIFSFLKLRLKQKYLDQKNMAKVISRLWWNKRNMIMIVNGIFFYWEDNEKKLIGFKEAFQTQECSFLWPNEKVEEEIAIGLVVAAGSVCQ